MGFFYGLEFAGIPFVLDQAQVYRTPTPGETGLDKGQLPLKKHQPECDLIDELDRLIPFEGMRDWSYPSYFQGKNLSKIARRTDSEKRYCPKIGDFYYPTTMSRWGIFRGLATSSQVKAMLAQTAGLTHGLFTMRSAPISPNNLTGSPLNYTVSTYMYMLPARPLAEHGGRFDGLYLVTLVDDRYYNQGTEVSFQIRQGTTWGVVLTSLASAMGITLSYSTLATEYEAPEPDSQFWASSENAPLLLDAAAANVGKTVVRLMNGSYTLYGAVESAAIVAQNLLIPQGVRAAGGDCFVSGNRFPVGDLRLARNQVMPSEVRVTFPKYVVGNDPVPHYSNPRTDSQRGTSWDQDSYGEVYSIGVGPLSGGGLGSGLTGVGVKTVKTTAKALYSGEVALGGNPLNMSGLGALACRIATDANNSQVIDGLDQVFPGTLNWAPEGIHDLTWTYSARDRKATLRVVRPEWANWVDDMQHATPPVSGMAKSPKGMGGQLVAQSWRDSYQTISPLSGAVLTTLADPIASGDYSCRLTGVGYFPTQNRWRGFIGSEAVLFEGTSGGYDTNSFGSVVSIAQRGIDGTLQTLHLAAEQVYQTFPNTQYGANLVTFEKGQVVHPHEVTSGGIAGVRVVPQTQSMYAFSASGAVVGGMRVYSGSVDYIDPVAPLSGFFTRQEYAWLVERNSGGITSGRRYQGQMAGYSASGIVRPLYIIDQPPTTAPAASYDGFNVRNTSGAKLYSGVGLVTFNEVDGYVMSNPNSGELRLDFSGATGGGGTSTYDDLFNFRSGGSTALVSGYSAVYASLRVPMSGWYRWESHVNGGAASLNSGQYGGGFQVKMIHAQSSGSTSERIGHKGQFQRGEPTQALGATQYGTVVIWGHKLMNSGDQGDMIVTRTDPFNAPGGGTVTIEETMFSYALLHLSGSLPAPTP